MATPASAPPLNSSGPLQSKTQIFTCPHAPCIQTFSSGLEYRWHLIDHEPASKSTFSCNLCSYASTVRDLLKDHLAQHFEGQEQRGFIKCSQCPFTTSYPAEFKDHRESVHGSLLESMSNHGADEIDNDYEPSQNESGEESEYISEVDDEENPGPRGPESSNYNFICPRDDCSESFRREYDFVIHGFNHLPKNEPVPCPHCTYIGKNRPLIVQHIVAHFDVTPFKCDECNARFKYKSAVQKHKVAKHWGKSGKKRSGRKKKKLLFTSIRNNNNNKINIVQKSKANIQTAKIKIKRLTDLRSQVLNSASKPNRHTWK